MKNASREGKNSEMSVPIPFQFGAYLINEQDVISKQGGNFQIMKNK